MPTFKDKIKPSDFEISGLFIGSHLQKSEKETVALNIVIIALENGDAWSDFTFEDYKNGCAPRTTFAGEKEMLRTLAHEDKILDEHAGVYSVNEMFFRTLAEFIKA